jgi:translation initiation factor IF-3
MSYTHVQVKNDPDRIPINEEIRAEEVRVVGPQGENMGVLPIREALDRARALGLDLIEMSSKAVPPVAKIMDYGKFTYEQKKKQRDVKAKAFVVETKSVQVKIGTGENDKRLKAERARAWLLEGHRVKVDLFLWGRYKYMEFDFLKERLENFLSGIHTPFKISEEIQKSPKGLSCVLERDRSKQDKGEQKEEIVKAETTNTTHGE